MNASQEGLVKAEQVSELDQYKKALNEVLAAYDAPVIPEKSPIEIVEIVVERAALTKGLQKNLEGVVGDRELSMKVFGFLLNNYNISIPKPKVEETEEA